MELVDVPDSKSGVGNYVSVRPRPSANKNSLRKKAAFIYLGRRGETTFCRFERERAEAGGFLQNDEITIAKSGIAV